MSQEAANALLRALRKLIHLFVGSQQGSYYISVPYYHDDDCNLDAVIRLER